MIVCLTITTWRETGGTHFYGRLREYDGEWTEKDLRVKYLLTAEQADAINEQDGITRRSCAYEAGEPSERFDTEQGVKEAAIRMAREKWGEDVEIYLGNPARALENMEKLLWVRPKA